MNEVLTKTNEEQKEEPSSSISQENELMVTLDELFLANMHFGYKTKYRNPWMNSYIFASRNGIDIIDLTKTVITFNKALQALKKCVARGGKVLFVGTEAHTSAMTRLQAERCAQYFINKRWLGGLLTNWRNTCESIISMKKIELQIEDGYLTNFKKSEQTRIIKKRDRFKRFLGGIKDMDTPPNMIVISSNRERNAIKEALKLNIPIVLLMDTTTNPEGIYHGIPGNDRSVKAVDKFISKCADACLAGLREEMHNLEVAKVESAKAEAAQQA
jgi:small subunit ribosomal protein S2